MGAGRRLNSAYKSVQTTQIYLKGLLIEIVFTWQDTVVRWSEEKADKATALEDRVKFQWLDGYLVDRLLHTITRDDVQAIGVAKAREFPSHG